MAVFKHTGDKNTFLIRIFYKFRRKNLPAIPLSVIKLPPGHSSPVAQGRGRQSTAAVWSGMVIAAVLLLGACFVVFPSQAREQSTPKEEVIYALLKDNGELNSLYVVNLFENLEGRIVDYGDYSQVSNLSTTDEIKQSGDQVTIDTTAERLNYQGTMEKASLPWNIAISYYLNGKQCTADAIAGQSGKLMLRLKITPDSKADSTFFDSYALQIAAVLPAANCSNIKAEGATVANSGSNKQITYTLLPGKGGDLKITADVSDFNMEPIVISGVRLSMNLDINYDELLAKFSQLSAAIAALDSGASELAAGTDELAAGLTALESGVGAVGNGLLRLDNNSAALTEGSAQVLAALQQIDTFLQQLGLSDLDLAEIDKALSAIKEVCAVLAELSDKMDASASAEAFRQKLEQYGVDPDYLQNSNQQLIAQLQQQRAALNERLAELEAQPAGEDTDSREALLQSLREQSALLEKTIALLEQNNAAWSDLEQYTKEFFAELQANINNFVQFGNAVNELADGLSDLLTLLADNGSISAGYAQLDAGLNAYTAALGQISAAYGGLADGFSALTGGAAALRAGSSQLADGVSQLNEQTGNMDEQIAGEVDEMLSSLTGESQPVVSFVSPDNTRITAVQFVIKTPAIAIEEAAVEDTPVVEPPSWWQRFLELFK